MTALLLGVSLILTFWLTRTIVITQFPPFIDESFHINFGNDVLTSGPLSHSEEGRQFTVWWYILFRAQANAPIATARLATVLVVTLSAAAVAAMALQSVGVWGMLFAGMLYTLNAYHTFFDRLALADPISEALVCIAIYFAYRLSRRAATIDAVLTGLALFCAVGAKISALPYLSIPLIAVVTLRPKGTTWRQRGRWLATAVLVEGILTAIFLGLLIWRGYDPFFYLSPTTVVANTSLETNIILSRIPQNMEVILSLIISYFGWLGLLGGILSLSYLAMRRLWFLPLAVILPLVVLWTSERQATRHLMVPMTLIALSIATAVAEIVRKRSLLTKCLVLLGLLVWLLNLWLPFVIAYLDDTGVLPLSTADQREYIASEGSGFGLAEIESELKQQHVTEVIGLFPNCLALKWMVMNDFPVNCPPINPNGSDIDSLAKFMHDNRKPGVYVVLETLSYLPANAPGRLATVIQRPYNGSILTIYDLSP